MSAAITITCSSCGSIYASDELHTCPSANVSTNSTLTTAIAIASAPASAPRLLQSYDELIDARVRQLMQEWPTLDEAHACVNCHTIMRTLANARCGRCGSESTFDLAIALASSSRTEHVGLSTPELEALIGRLDAALTEGVIS